MKTTNWLQCAVLMATLTACAALADPLQDRVKQGQALFDDRCKNVAGQKIYKTVEDVEGIVLLKLRPKRGDRELSDPNWSGAAFPRERTADGYIETFLGYEHAFGQTGAPTQPVTSQNRGYIGSDYQPGNPSNLPGYRYVDVIDEKDTQRYRYVLIQKPRPTSQIGWIDTVLDRKLTTDTAPRYGVTFEDHVIPEDRALGVASSTVKVLDLKTQEVLGEMTRYAWTPASPNASNPTPWLTAYNCGNHTVMADTITRQFVDQILKPRKAS